MKPPTVSILIPTLNRRRMLESLLDRLGRLASPAGRLQVVVADDGSTDGTAEMIERAAPPFRLLLRRHSAPRGSAAARNAAIDAADGEVLWLLDDDVVPDPDALQEHLALLAERPEAASLGDVRPEETDAPRVAVRLLASMYARSRGSVPDRAEIPFTLCDTANLAIRRETLGGIRFDERFIACGNEDFEWGIRLVAKGIPLVRNRRARVSHRTEHLRLEGMESKRWIAGRNARLLVSLHPEAAGRLEPPRPPWRRAFRACAVNPATLPWMRRAARALERPAAPLSAFLYERVLGDAYRRGFRGFQPAAAGEGASRRPVRVAFLISTLDLAGAEKQFALLASSLDRSRFEPFVLCLRRGGPYEERLRRAGIPIWILGQRAKLSIPLWLRLRAALRAIRPRILHTWMFTSHFYGRTAGRSAGVPLLVAGERCVDRWKTLLHWMIDRRLARVTDAFVANSGATLSYLGEKGIFAPRMVSIPNALPDDFPPLGAPRGEPEWDLLAAGRLHPQKDYPTLLSAFRLLLATRHGATLAIAGAGPEEARLRGLSAAWGLERNVRFLGLRSDVHDLLLRARAFVLSSAYEGSPNALLEAMALGTPVVTTDAGGAREIVPPGCADVVPVGDPAALAAAMERVLADPAGALARAARAAPIVRERHSLRGVVLRYETLYEELLRMREENPRGFLPA